MNRKADQGKWAEDKVRAWLNAYQQRLSGFCFNRILDARSARGAMANPQPGDFQWFLRTGYWIVEGMGLAAGPGDSTIPHYTRNGLIEVKSVQHTHLLPYKNFSPDQIARMRIRELAGSEPLILVAFRPEGLKPFWRTAPLEFFEDQHRKGSWDMSGIDAYTHCDDILEDYFK